MESFSPCMTSIGIDVQEVCGHRLETLGAVYLERHTPSERPRTEDEVWVADGVVGVKVSDEGHAQPGRFEGADGLLEKRGVRTPDDSWPEINQIRRGVDDNRGGQPRSIGDRGRIAGAQKNNSGPGWRWQRTLSGGHCGHRQH
jgi:hypothetical protein